MTPRQFFQLLDRHREQRAHEELVGGFIAAAVKNYSMNPPEAWAVPLDFMPSHSKAVAARPALSDEELERISDFNLRVAEAALQLGK